MPEKENITYANCLDGLGMDYYNQKEYKSAELYCRKAIEISKKYLGASNIYYAGYLVNLGSVLSEIKNYSEAFKCYSEALEIYKIKGSDQLDHYAAVLNNIGLLEGQNKNYVNTEIFFNEALKIYKDKYGENNYSYAHQLFNLSDLYLLTNDPRSLQYFIDAYNIEKKYFYKNSYNLTESQNEFYKKDLYSKTIKFQNLINFKSVENSNIISNMYSNWINLNGLTYNQSIRLKNEVLSSKNDTLINNYYEYKLIKSQLMNYNNTSSLNNNLNELESKANFLEKEIILKSHEFKEFKEYSFDDLQSKIKPDEAFVDIIRVPNYNFNNDGDWGISKEKITYIAYITTSETKLKPEIVMLVNGNELENEIIKLYKEDTFGKKRKEFNKSGFYYDNYWKPIESKLINKKKILISFSGVYKD
jgi:tetratricopeptide (TPR) repeat protein